MIKLVEKITNAVKSFCGRHNVSDDAEVDINDSGGSLDIKISVNNNDRSSRQLGAPGFDEQSYRNMRD